MKPAPSDTANTDETKYSNRIDSLLHPQAQLIRRLLTRSETQAVDELILIDDEENILQAIRANVVVRSIFHSSDHTVSDELRRQLPATPRQVMK